MEPSKKSALVILILAFVGFMDASYLTAEHFLGRIPPCSVAGSNCADVLTSPYATVAGVPLSLLGAIYYLAVVLLSAVYYKETDRHVFLSIMIIVGLTGVGALASLLLIYVQIFVIKALCIYCMVSAATSFLLVTLSAISASKTINLMKIDHLNG